MPSDETARLKAPGLKRRGKKKERLHWVARPDIVKAGYRPKTVRLSFDENDPDQRKLIEVACQKLQAEMLEWQSGRKNSRRGFDGTLGSLVRCYQVDEASPYRNIKWNTQRTYDQVLGVIEKAFGTRALPALGISDFRNWYDAAKKPKLEGGPERVRKAHGIVSMLRRLFAYGIMAEYSECVRLARILDEARFKQPVRRKAKLEYHHVIAFVTKAVELNRLSLALATALQFETILRQKDVIGEWEPIGNVNRSSGITLGNRRWANGLTWSHIPQDLVFSKETTKTGAIVGHDLKLGPIVLDVIAKIPPEQRVGPLIIDELARRPYAPHAFTREWRVIARAAGIPDTIWNMDARAGAISEADDAGADLDSIRSAAGHSQASTTARYVRGPIEKSRRVARLRIEYRARKQDGNEK